MKNYSHIGFDINSEKDEKDFFHKIYTNNNYPIQKWNIETPEHKNLVLSMQNLGEILYFTKLENNTLLDTAIIYNNENINKLNVVSVYTSKDNNFPLLELGIDGYAKTFWFECANADIFNIQNKETCDVKISCLPYSISIKKQSDSNTNEYFFPDTWDEAYNPCKAMLQGIIQGYTIKKNIVTEKDYYCIDVECLGLHIKVVADISMLTESNLAKGNIICGKVWCNAIIL